MYQVIVDARFTATHSIRLHDGTVEPLHGHDWVVQATFARQSLDGLGMVIDFQDARKAVLAALSRLDYGNLNELPEFQGKNPTTEVVAQWILERLGDLGFDTEVQVRLTEAPGCQAIFTRNSAALATIEDET